MVRQRMVLTLSWVPANSVLIVNMAGRWRRLTPGREAASVSRA